MKYRWIQLTDTLSKLWKGDILNCKGNSMDLSILDHLLIKKKKLELEQVRKESAILNTNFSKVQRNQLCRDTIKDISATLIFTEIQYIYFQRMVIVDTKLRVFQIQNNILFVNKILFKLKKRQSPLYSFCKAEDKISIYIFL